jgi:YfiH family protein
MRQSSPSWPTVPFPSDWIVPEWSVPTDVRAVFTGRAGGESLPPYDSLNLGTHVGDDQAMVAHNRALVQQALGVIPVYVQQVHGTGLCELSDPCSDLMTADAVHTRQRGVACSIMVADCLPILLCDTDTGRVGALHAGWRGLAGVGGKGVVEVAIEEFRHLAQAGYAPSATKIIAWLGPCIGPEAFEVGPEVRNAFVAHNPAAQNCFAPGNANKWFANLPALAAQRLAAMGVTDVTGNDGSLSWCTVSNPLRFFSYRRDGVCGRHAAFIWRV